MSNKIASNKRWAQSALKQCKLTNHIKCSLRHKLLNRVLVQRLEKCILASKEVENLNIPYCLIAMVVLTNQYNDH